MLNSEILNQGNEKNRPRHTKKKGTLNPLITFQVILKFVFGVDGIESVAAFP